jgi:hypothetical protein
MKALSIRQPWAWLIIHGGKNVENRTWPTKFRGRFMVHASKGMTRSEYYSACAFVASFNPRLSNLIPLPCDLQFGGYIGSVEVFNCVSGNPGDARSDWLQGPFGFFLREPRSHPFSPGNGRLGFFDVAL